MPLEVRRTIVNPATTRDVPTPQRNISNALNRNHYDTWGFVIYRTDYDSDELWSRCKHIITTNAKEQIEDSDAPEVVQSLTWTFFDDRVAFQGASKAELRMHFNQWALDNWQLEQPRGEIMETPRYQYFVEVDRDVLDSMPETLDKRALMDISYVNFVDAQWRPLAERSPNEPPEHHEPIEGVTDEDVGWMRIHAYLVGSEAFELFDEQAVWYSQYQRPPEIMPY